MTNILAVSSKTSIGRSAAASGAGLGSITKSTPAQPETPRITYAQARRIRHGLTETASATLGRLHRVSSCQKVPSYGVQQGSDARGISLNSDGNASFHGVGSCGDVWCCPRCSQRIAETRRKEILQAMSENRKNGGVAVMVTFTFPHHKFDDLKLLVKNFMAALSKMKGRRAYKKLTDSLGYIGQIRALEVTHSDDNGWHPHAHEIWFLDHEPTVDQLQDAQDDLYELWSLYALKQGLSKPSRLHGVRIDFRKGDQGGVGSYVSKFGFELTYAHIKTGRNGSRTPWGILKSIQDKYSWQDVKLFKQYAEAFKGRAQLFWSRGLKDMFGINDVKDEVIADAQEEVVVMNLDANDWSLIVRFKAHCIVLEIAETLGSKGVRDYLGKLADIDQHEYAEKMRLKRQINEHTIRRMVEMGLVNVA